MTTQDTPQGMELKACPFCGGAARKGDVYRGISEPSKWHYIWCSCCGAKTDESLNFEHVFDLWNTRDYVPDDAIKRAVGWLRLSRNKNNKEIIRSGIDQALSILNAHEAKGE